MSVDALNVLKPVALKSAIATADFCTSKISPGVGSVVIDTARAPKSPDDGMNSIVISSACISEAVSEIFIKPLELGTGRLAMFAVVIAPEPLRLLTLTSPAVKVEVKKTVGSLAFAIAYVKLNAVL